MKIRFVGRGRLSDPQDDCEEMDDDLTIYGFGCLEEVSYEKELKGESDFFEKAARLSKQTKKVVVCGCVTDTRGIKRKSALVAENGRLIGVSDMTHAVDGTVGCGAGLRVYDTKIGRMGVAVAEDVFFPDVIQSLSACGSDFIVCPYGLITDGILQVVLRASAYLYGVPIFLCGVGYCMIVNVDGSISFATPQSPVSVTFESIKEYHLIQTRKRGMYRVE